MWRSLRPPQRVPRARFASTVAAHGVPRRRKLYIYGSILVAATASVVASTTIYSDAVEEAPLRTRRVASRLSSTDGAHINQTLRERERTVVPDPESGIRRYDVGQVASNSPCEDEVVHATLSVPSGRWSFFGVYDGHSGWDTAVYLREHLVAAVSGALADLYHSLLPTSSTPEEARPEPSTEDVEKTLKSTFKEVDDDLVHGALERVLASSNPRTAAMRALGPAYSGACALLAFYDSHSRLLHVAVTGDSRAVLGRRIPAPNEHDPPSYEVHVLSVDQDGHNAAEATRLEAEHPGEAVVRNGRVLGMGPARAFGDARYKWPRDVQQTLKRDHLGRSPIREVKTPPYLTAEPEVITIHVQPGDFLVLASDGLWEALNNDDAVGLVGWWLQTQDRRLGTAQGKVVVPEDLPVCRRQDEELQRSVRYGQWNASKRFVVEDDNAATHLIRNALGGANSDLLNALLLIPAPRSRVYRDDITATVVFFDDAAEPPS